MTNLGRIAMGGALSLGLAVLAGCGQQTPLRYASNKGPAVPVGEKTAPTPTEVLTPTMQSRPKRNDELLRQSEERAPDPFDLPPQ